MKRLKELSKDWEGNKKKAILASTAECKLLVSKNTSSLGSSKEQIVQITMIVLVRSLLKTYKQQTFIPIRVKDSNLGFLCCNKDF